MTHDADTDVCYSRLDRQAAVNSLVQVLRRHMPSCVRLETSEDNSFSRDVVDAYYE